MKDTLCIFLMLIICLMANNILSEAQGTDPESTVLHSSQSVDDLTDELDLGWFTAEATAYTAWCEGCIGITADGTDVRGAHGQNIIAVDTRFHSFGTEFDVEFPSGEVKRYIARDRGGAIKGPARIDILMNSREEALEFGRRNIRIRLVDVQ